MNASLRAGSEGGFCPHHPNIITIYEIGETGNRHFIAADYIDGQTLLSRLNGGPMSLTDRTLR